MCLNNEVLSPIRLSCNIHSLSETISSSFQTTATAPPPSRLTRWNENNYQCTILNVDGSCNSDPIRMGFGGVLRNHSGAFLAAFSRHINLSQDILFAELSALYQGLKLVISLNYEELVCYSYSIITVNLVKDELSHFHVYAVLIQNIKDLMSSRNFTLHHSLREGNQCADFMAKLGASNNVDLVIHSSPPGELLPLLRTDELRTLFIRR